MRPVNAVKNIIAGEYQSGFFCFVLKVLEMRKL